jgi:hypothetical protein
MLLSDGRFPTVEDGFDWRGRGREGCQPETLVPHCDCHADLPDSMRTLPVSRVGFRIQETLTDQTPRRGGVCQPPAIHIPLRRLFSHISWGLNARLAGSLLLLLRLGEDEPEDEDPDDDPLFGERPRYTGAVYRCAT